MGNRMAKINERMGLCMGVLIQRGAGASSSEYHVRSGIIKPALRHLEKKRKKGMPISAIL
jgi:hypothetical protein